MPYDMEEQEDYLKQHSPYDLDKGQWEAMQQRLKAKVLADRAQHAPPRRRKRLWRPAASLAAGIALILSLYVVQRENGPAGKVATAPSLTAEQRLDKAISGLSDADLSWVHQLNEEELPEAGEPDENE
ncbi:hypothetical protein [Taibaiella koreensis]|uniref:hypothetical protein n=1 Tax=Taibaiella koreensis TaxID=1268548 RepID=UPI0013C2F6EA|nr:hypothetical protein [Taibaiella koreensis]